MVFSDRSLGSIIKSHGKRNFDNYTKLKTLEKNNMNLCLNGILDLTNNMEGGQKELFSNDEWNQLKIKFQHKNKIPKLSKETLESLEAIKKVRFSKC